MPLFGRAQIMKSQVRLFLDWHLRALGKLKNVDVLDPYKEVRVGRNVNNFTFRDLCRSEFFY